jgi:hypothetical protein
MLTVELFGFKASKYIVEAEIIKFFKEFDSKIDGQIIFYDIEPKNFKGENTRVVKLIASDNRVVKRLRRSKFLQLECLKDVNVGLFHYIVAKKADPVVE